MGANSFIHVTAQPFAPVFAGKVVGARIGAAERAAGRTSPAYDHVRRPYRGVQLKEETFATIEVVKSNGEPILLANSSVPGGEGSRYSNFILQSISERRTERQQLVETFGETWIFFSGESPRTLSCAGMLVNSADFQWRNEFWHNYDNFLRGTQCARVGARIYLSYDDVLVEGYMLSASAASEAQTQHVVQFSFEFLVTRHVALVQPGETQFPLGETGVHSSPAPYVSDTLRVRELNAQSHGGSGNLLANLSGFLKSTRFSLAKAVKDLEHAVYGRNVRVPFGFAGGEVYSGTAYKAVGSYDASRQMPWLTNKKRGHTHDNIDEYPQRADPDALAWTEGARPIPRREEDYEARARRIFAEAGIEVDDSSSPLGRFLTRTAFGVLCVGAAFAAQGQKKRPGQRPRSSDPSRASSSGRSNPAGF